MSQPVDRVVTGRDSNEEFDLACDFLNRAIPEDCIWVTENG